MPFPFDRSPGASQRGGSPRVPGRPRRAALSGAGAGPRVETGAGRTKRSPAEGAPSEAGMAASRARQGTKAVRAATRSERFFFFGRSTEA